VRRNSAFSAIFQNEVLLNSKRVAPYLMALLCAGNGLLWWGWGPATGRRWAVNADFFIAGALPVYSFMTLPLFTALFAVDPLIFSKPISCGAYLLGKFFGNFFVLVCCQSAFVLTWFALQAVHKQGVITQGVKVVPYVKHFFVFVVISHLFLASFYFAVGVLTRIPKIVYGLGVVFYPVYITYQTVLLSSLPWRWRLALDPLVMNRGRKDYTTSAEVLNQLVIVYDTDLIINRAMMILLAAICLTIVYLRFATTERSVNVENFSVLNLSTAAERPYYSSESLPVTRIDRFMESDAFRKEALPLPKVDRAAPGIRASITKLIGAVGVELRVLRAERSLIILVPLIVFFSIFEPGFYKVVPEISYSAAYASSTAHTLVFFLLGLTVFYTGEVMHRDRELRIAPVLWATPVPNSVLLLSKFLATLLLGLALILVVSALAIAIQILKGDTPVNISAYVVTYSVILVPNLVFMIGVAITLNVLLRDKYVAYAISIGLGIGLFYLYGYGYNNWLYNPLLYRLWKYVDLTSTAGTLQTILTHRLYCLAIASTCLSLAHLLFQRKSTKRLWVDKRLTSRGWAISAALVSVAVALFAGLSIISSTH
jgi:ABC-2 type transport system permease protein